ncbi:uncharacterized protein VTP21DRAFT_11629 [Calcarisporiella thermophila]|uniref:uncharacterized protein n=1 Tax=Calcarisporiella thermophila TaxID=911321 RepID=UPI0037436A95
MLRLGDTWLIEKPFRTERPTPLYISLIFINRINFCNEIIFFIPLVEAYRQVPQHTAQEEEHIDVGLNPTTHASSSASTQRKQPKPANEIHITTQGKVRNYISYGLDLLQEKKHTHLILSGKGKAINKTVTVTEIIKRRMEGTLHQYTQIGSVNATDVWEPLEQNLDKVKVTRHLPVITIYLSTTAIPELEETSGYQPPTGKDIYGI